MRGQRGRQGADRGVQQIVDEKLNAFGRLWLAVSDHACFEASKRVDEMADLQAKPLLNELRRKLNREQALGCPIGLAIAGARKIELPDRGVAVELGDKAHVGAFVPACPYRKPCPQRKDSQLS